MTTSAKCDFSVTAASAASARPVMISSAKCDFTILAQGFSVMKDSARAGLRLDLAETLGTVKTSSSKCDWKVSVEDHLDRFSLTTRIAASSKCDFSVLVDFGLRDGAHYRAAGSSDKCDFVFSRLTKLSNPGPDGA